MLNVSRVKDNCSVNVRKIKENVEVILICSQGESHEQEN